MNITKFRLFALLIISIGFVVKADDLEKFYLCENYQSIAIEKLSTGHDVIAVTLNGVNAKFVLDTGAKMSLINKYFLSKYSINKKLMLSKEKAAGAAGENLAELYPLNSLYFEDNKIQVKTIAATELSQIINGLGYTTDVWIDGIIGQDVLLEHSGIIDSSNKKLLIKTNLAILNLSINNKHGEFILDSGAGSSMVNENSMSKFGLSKNSIVDSRQSSGAGGAFTFQTLEIDSFEINSKPYDIATINALDLSAVIKEVKEHSQVDAHGVIGQDLLKKYGSIISFYDNRLYLKSIK